jgi:hypothetical protein
LEIDGSRKRSSHPGIIDSCDMRSKNRICIFTDPEDRIANLAGGRYKKPGCRRSPSGSKGVQLIRHCKYGRLVARFPGDCKPQHQQ